MTIGDDVRLVISKVMKIPLEGLTDDTKLEELGAESLDVIEMAFELEEKFDIAISLSPKLEGRLFTTVDDVAQEVKKLVDAKAAR